MIPPDEKSIGQFENVLHNPVAIDYFYEYLETLEAQEENNGSFVTDENLCEYGRHTNNFRLLALYMDIRCYESVIRKVKESPRYVKECETRRTEMNTTNNYDMSIKNSARFGSESMSQDDSQGLCKSEPGNSQKR